MTASTALGANNVVFTLNNKPGSCYSGSSKGGDAQHALVGTAYQQGLKYLVVDGFNNPVPRCQVVFTSPASPKAGVLFKAAVTDTETTDDTGIATSIVPTANTTAGLFYVSAGIVGQPSTVISTAFVLTNDPGPAVKLIQCFIAAPPKGLNYPDPTVVKGIHYASANGTFGPLIVQIADTYGNPIYTQNVPITFQGVNPAKAPGGTFAGPNTNPKNATLCTPKTNAVGSATSDPLTANANVGGPFNVTASAPNLKSTTFKLQIVGQVTVPNVLGMTVAQATAALLAQKLNVSVGPAGATGYVLLQLPLAGAQVDVGTTINLVAAAGN